MKKVLFATTALVLSAGFAAAEVSVSGDGRMGFVYDGNDMNFSSRVRAKFTMTGETDAGLSFGGEFEVHNAEKAAEGGSGKVYVSGTYGKLSMGDLDSAAHAAVGHIDGVGFTALGDKNEMTYLTSGADGVGNPSALYEYTMGSTTVYASMVDGHPNSAWSLAAKYAMDTYTVALGYEKNSDTGVDHIALGGSGTFGAVTVKGTLGRASDIDFTQYGLSGTYDAGATDVTAFFMRKDMAGAEYDSFGLGATHDLGGGAKLAGGIVDSDYNDDVVADFGIKFDF